MSAVKLSAANGNVASEPLAPTRARPNKALGEQFAELMKEPHAHQLGVCARMRISYATFKRWMANEEPDADLAEFQAAVLDGLDRARRADLTDMETAVLAAAGTHAGTVWNMRKHRHESRFKRFYDDPQKVELTGKDGGPVEHKHAFVAQLPDSELLAIVTGDKKLPSGDEGEQ